MTRLSLVFALCSTFAVAQDLPPGKARAIVATKCGECHSLDVVTATGASKARWRAVLEEMVTNGAKLTKAEIKLVVSYLAKNYPAPISPVP